MENKKACHWLWYK